MKAFFVFCLMALSFAGGVYFGQTTSLEFAGRVDAFIASWSEDTGEAEASARPTGESLSPNDDVGETDTPPRVNLPQNAAFTPDARLQVCPRMTVSNAPGHDADFWISGFRPFVNVEGVVLAIAPTNEACLSSGFGMRSGSFHKGLDFRADPAGSIHAAADGRIVEAGYRDDYGNYVVIDHGGGVFTRYAHLAGLSSGIQADTDISFGTLLGPMGNTASYSIPVHLHYEVLLGDYNTPAASFGLEAKSPFDFPYAS